MKSATTTKARKVSPLAREILAYLERNPQASDSIAGIAEYWVAHEGTPPVAAEVQRALDELVSLGLVLRMDRGDGSAGYCLNPQPRSTPKQPGPA